jgi:hypothetical protein
MSARPIGVQRRLKVSVTDRLRRSASGAGPPIARMGLPPSYVWSIQVALAHEAGDRSAPSVSQPKILYRVRVKAADLAPRDRVKQVECERHVARIGLTEGMIGLHPEAGKPYPALHLGSLITHPPGD